MLRVPYVFERPLRSAAGRHLLAPAFQPDRAPHRGGQRRRRDILVAQLFYLESVDREKDIYFYINSPGGVVTAGLAMYDVMQFVSCDVATICLGQAASMGAVLLAAGPRASAWRCPRPDHDPPAAGGARARPPTSRSRRTR